MRHFVILIFLTAFVFSCNNSKNKEYSAIEKQQLANKHPGKKLMENNCYLCHSPTASEADRVGPPMIAIKKHYITENTTKEAFIEAMQTWIKNPTAEDALMHGAVKRFGVMPKQAYPEETIHQISDFMYDFDIEQPDWFEDHFNEEKGIRKGKGKGKGKGKVHQKEMHRQQQVKASFDTLPYDERGLKYALSTKAVLGKNLMGTIQKKGTIEALAFCNEQAYPLTDSMSVAHNAIIKRVSDKPRNPNNQANIKELAYIESFKKDIKNNIEPKPIVDELDSQVQVYYPITTNAMCLQCHGKPEENITRPTLDKLKNLYADDKAIGYDLNEVRGIWTVTFDK